MCWLIWCHPNVLPAVYVLVGVLPPHCVGLLRIWWLMWCHPILLPAMHVLVAVVPLHCVAWYVRTGWCGATHFVASNACAGQHGTMPMRCLVRMCWLVYLPPHCVAWYAFDSLEWDYPITLPGMNVLVGVVPPHSVACYACAGWHGTTPLRCLVCMCLFVCCHPIVLPGMHVLVGVEPPHCVAWYVYAGCSSATPLCCLVCMCWLVYAPHCVPCNVCSG